jgi:hypothetical protein
MEDGPLARLAGRGRLASVFNSAASLPTVVAHAT